jgi:hypothetical protein
MTVTKTVTKKLMHELPTEYHYSICIASHLFNDITILDTSEIDGNLDQVIHIFPMDRRHSQHNCVVAHLMVKQDWGTC